jgi:hypothetical protein
MAAQTPEVKYLLSDDKSRVTISINNSEATFNTKEFEGLLGWLGVVRSQMIPIVPAAVQDGMQVSQLTHVFLGHLKDKTPLPVESGMVMAVRSEMYGWLEFTAQPEFCRGMAAWLQSEGQPAADVQPTPPPK